MLSLLMTTEYAPAEDRHELQQLLLRVAGGERSLAELYQRTRSAGRPCALHFKMRMMPQDLTQTSMCRRDCSKQYCPTGSKPPMAIASAAPVWMCLRRESVMPSA